MLSIVLLSTTAIADISVTPDTVTYNQTQGYDTKTFTVYNDANTTVNVSISTSSPYIIIPTHNLTIPANSSSQFVAVFLLNFSYNSTINLHAGNQTVTINVAVVPKKTEKETNITLLPSPPRAGKNLLIKLTQSTNKIGYVLTEAGNVYLTEFKEGLALISLADDDYGTATLVVGNQTMTFEIASSFRNLIIECDNSITIGDNFRLTVYADTTPVLSTVTFVSPSGENMTRVVNGTASFDLDEVGEWQITAQFQNMETQTTVRVKPKPLSLSVPQDVKVNEPVTISIGRPATVTISKNEITWTYTTSGTVTFTPPWSGRYDVKVTTEDGEEGTASFTATENIYLDVVNENGLPATFADVGDTLIIRAVDSNGNTVHKNVEVDVNKDGLYYSSITLHGGTAVFTVKDEASQYTFSTDASSVQVNIEQNQSLPVIPIIAVVITAVVVMLLVLLRKGLIHIPELNIKLPEFKSKYDDLF